MGLPLPGENFQGYAAGSLYRRAMHIMGKELFLIHGMADPNVHLQNSMVLANHLVAHNVPFQQQVNLFCLFDLKKKLYNALFSFTQMKATFWKVQKDICTLQFCGFSTSVSRRTKRKWLKTIECFKNPISTTATTTVYNTNSLSCVHSYLDNQTVQLQPFTIVPPPSRLEY